MHAKPHACTPDSLSKVPRVQTWVKLGCLSQDLSASNDTAACDVLGMLMWLQSAESDRLSLSPAAVPKLVGATPTGLLMLMTMGSWCGTLGTKGG